jgi:hypothetical protein
MKPPSDGPQLPIWLADEWNNRRMFRVAAYVVAGRRDAMPVQSLLDKYLADIREQIGSSAAPLFLYDPSPYPIDLDRFRGVLFPKVWVAGLVWRHWRLLRPSQLLCTPVGGAGRRRVHVTSARV